MPASLEEVGLPSGRTHRVQSVSYSKVADAFVAVLEPFELAGAMAQRIFVRGRAESRYREVELPNPLAAATHVIVCSDAPLAVANLTEWSSPAREKGERLGLYRVALPSGALEKLPEPVNPRTAPERVSVIAIVAASGSGDELHLIVSVPSFVRLPPAVGHSMGFFLASYSSRCGHVELIDHVPTTVA